MLSAFLLPEIEVDALERDGFSRKTHPSLSESPPAGSRSHHSGCGGEAGRRRLCRGTGRETGHGNLRLRSHRAPGNCMQGSNPTAGLRLSLGNAEHLGILVQSGTAEHSSIPALRRLVHTSVALSLSNAH